jgi:hypothetical protein
MMNKLVSSLAAGAALMAPAAFGADATPSPLQSQVQTHLRMEIGKDVDEVHFISTNSDPDVFTKVYLLKNVDPYEISYYVMAAIGGFYNATDNTPNNEYGRRVNASPSKVECIKYMDGVGALIISAEDYRFTDTGKQNAMSIDEIVATLDQKGLIWNNNQAYMLYFPKYLDAASLANVISRSGLTVANDPWELQGARTPSGSTHTSTAFSSTTRPFRKAASSRCWPSTTSPFRRPSSTTPSTKSPRRTTARSAWTSRLGSTDPAATSSRGRKNASRNWDATAMAPVMKSGSSTTKYMNFSPKWNTKFLDFLVTKSKANVVTSGSLSVMNSSSGYVGSTTQLPTITTGATRAPAASRPPGTSPERTPRRSGSRAR